MSEDPINIEVQTTSGVFEPATSASLVQGLVPLDLSSGDEDQENSQPPLGVELTGYHLLNMVVILGSGIWKILSSYPGLPITLTRMELIAATIGGTILYHIKVIHDKRPETCPRFFQVDLAPPILKFVWRSEAYLFLLSLIPILALPENISFALDVIRDAKHGNIESGPYLAAIRVLLLIAASIVFIFTSLSLLLSVAHLETPRRYLASIEDILFKSSIGIGILLVLLVSPFLTSMNDAQGHDTYTAAWDVIFNRYVSIIVIVLGIPNIEGSGIVSRSLRVARTILSVATFIRLTLRENPLFVIRGYNLDVYLGGGMLVSMLYDTVTGNI